jgi:hypothetical protein
MFYAITNILLKVAFNTKKMDIWVEVNLCRLCFCIVYIYITLNFHLISRGGWESHSLVGALWS